MCVRVCVCVCVSNYVNTSIDARNLKTYNENLEYVFALVYLANQYTTKWILRKIRFSAENSLFKFRDFLLLE